MKLSEYRKRSVEFSTKSSDIIRQMILAGVGIIWLFKDKDKNELDQFAIYPLIALAIAALLDLSQYVIGGQTWIKFFRREERRAAAGTDPEIKAPEYLAQPLYFFYWAKIAFTIIAYALIFCFLFKNLHFK